MTAREDLVAALVQHLGWSLRVRDADVLVEKLAAFVRETMDDAENTKALEDAERHASIIDSMYFDGQGET